MRKEGLRDNPGPSFPSHDGGGTTSSSMLSTADGAISTEQVLGILQKYLCKDKNLAEEVSALLPRGVVDNRI